MFGAFPATELVNSAIVRHKQRAVLVRTETGIRTSFEKLLESIRGLFKNGIHGSMD